MSQGFNKVTLLGNVCADPEFRVTQNGSILKFRLATNEVYLDKNRAKQERVDFHSLVIWGKRGEALSRLIQKGTMLFVEGAIRTSSYDDKDGNKRYKTEIVATEVILCGGRPRQAESAPTGGADFDYSAETGPSSDDSPFPF